MKNQILLSIFLFVCYCCAFSLAGDVIHSTFEVHGDSIFVFAIYNYANNFSRSDKHIWMFTAVNRSQITLRNRYAFLYPGDKVTITDAHGPKNKILANYGLLNSSVPKVTSFSNTVIVELTSEANFTTPVISSTSQIFGFNFTFEVYGFCSPENDDRKPCGLSHKHQCYSASEDRCDGWWDCPLDGIDELGCPSCQSPPQYACASPNHKASCYSKTERCDGHYHCADKTDEVGCLPSQCSVDALRFLCVNATDNEFPPERGECIPLDHICDGVFDCTNKVDEGPDLCTSVPDDASPAASRHSRTAQKFANQLVRRILHDEIAATSVRLDSRLRTLLTYVLSALLGPMLIIVMAGFMCNSGSSSLQAGAEMRRARRSARFNSPIQRLIRDEIRRRPPPPTYDEALNNSLFEEPIIAGVPLPAPPEPRPGALSQARVVAVRELSVKPAPVHVDVAVYCDLPFDPSFHAIEVGEEEEEEGQLTPHTGTTPSPQTSSAGRFGRWFLSWKRGLVLRRPYEQPEVSETTVISSIQEENDENDGFVARRGDQPLNENASTENIDDAILRVPLLPDAAPATAITTSHETSTGPV